MKHLALHLCLASALAFFSGCKTTPDDESGDKIMTEKEMQNAVGKTKMPQFFGFQAYPVNNGIEFQGEARLHPNHLASCDFLEKDIPAIELRGKAKRLQLKALVDTSSPSSWIEYSTAEEFGVSFLGMNGNPFPYRGGYNTGGAAAFGGVISQLRFDQLFVENAPMYVRMSRGSLGPLARGVLSPKVKAVIGWDMLRLFEFVQFDLRNNTVGFSTSTPFAPRDEMVMSATKILDIGNYGLAVEGSIFGKPTPIILDVAGDYHFARGDVRVGVTKQVSIGEVVYRKVPTMLLPINNTPPRAGRRMLDGYLITICPKLDMVFFERYPGE